MGISLNPFEYLKLSKTEMADVWAGTLQLSTSEFCCGLTEIGEFGSELNRAVSNVTYAKALRNWLNEDNRIQSCVLATLSDYQLKSIKPVLELTGFEEVQRFNNKNTKNVVHVFIATRGTNGKF
jgi:hypothetical protein